MESKSSNRHGNLLRSHKYRVLCLTLTLTKSMQETAETNKGSKSLFYLFLDSGTQVINFNEIISTFLAILFNPNSTLELSRRISSNSLWTLKMSLIAFWSGVGLGGYKGIKK